MRNLRRSCEYPISSLAYINQCISSNAKLTRRITEKCSPSLLPQPFFTEGAKNFIQVHVRSAQDKLLIFHPHNLSWKYLVNTYMTIRVSPTSFVLIVYLIWQKFFLFRPKYHGCIIFLCDGLFAVLPLDQTVICGIFAQAFTIACCGLCRIQVALRDILGWIWMQMQV